ncbi:MAG: IS3 family transposase [Candidatus Polarisedimenticolia bacterium]
MARDRRKFSEEFKLETVQLVKNSGKSIREVAKELDLTESSLRYWVQQHEIDGGEKEGLTTSEREELVRLRRENMQLKVERDILKKANGLLRQGKQLRFRFIAAEKANFPIAMLCRVLGVARSGYYAWLDRPEPSRVRRDRDLLEKIRQVFQKSRRTYGSPRVHEEFQSLKVVCGRRRVERLMRENAITPPRRKRFKATTFSNHRFDIAENLLARDFTSEGPNRRWATDITYIWTGEGWLYLAVVLDLFSRRVVGWSMDSDLDHSLVVRALRTALQSRSPQGGLLHHSDRGSQYACAEYQHLLKRHGIVSSMSRKGDCWDNAVVESFFRTLKVELIYRQEFSTRQQARASIFDFIEVFYNRQRRHSYLGYRTPEEFEKAELGAA